MKQHSRFLRVVSLLLVPASLIWLCAALVRPGMVQYSYVTVEEIETETCISVSGLIVRDERILTADAPFRAVLPAEGEKVARGQAIAVTSADAAILQEQTQISSLKQTIHRLTLAFSSDPTTADSTIRRLLTSHASAPQTEAERDRLKSLVLCLDNNPDQLSAALRNPAGFPPAQMAGSRF